MKFRPLLILLAALRGFAAPAQDALPANPKDNGYRGIWFTLGQKSDYGDRYSGGLATYTARAV